MYDTLARALVAAHGMQTETTVYTDTAHRYYVEEGFLTTRDALPRHIVLLFHVAPHGILRDCLAQAQVRAAAQSVAEKNRGRFACGIMGHSALVRIEGEKNTGARFCTRCGDRVPPAVGQVELGVNVRANRDAFRVLDWRHKLYGVRTPFGERYRINNF